MGGPGFPTFQEPIPAIFSQVWKCSVGTPLQGSHLTNRVEGETMSSELTILEYLAKAAGPRNNAEDATMNKELTMRGLLLVLKRRRAVMLWAASACFLFGIIVCIFLKPRYRAIGEIEIQKSATDSLGLQNLITPGQQQTDA